MTAGGATRSEIYGIVVVAILFVLTFFPAAIAQDLDNLDEDLPVALVADEVTFDRETGIVTARGSVEIFYGERTLTAKSVSYDTNQDIFSAEGDIAIRNQTGEVIFADIAELDGKLRNGLARGARAVLTDGSRMSAVAVRRIDGDTNALSKAVFSSCLVCVDDPEPLWQIRARRVVHDQVEKNIYYEDAVFEIEGVPVIWTPYFSHADPTVKRRTGFLTPKIQSSSIYGYGMQFPYHIVLGPDRDMTLTPFITLEDSSLLFGEYRAVKETGFYEIDGSVTQADYDGDDELRWHTFAKARFNAPAEFKYGADVQLSSDDDYLRRYDISGKDRLTTELFLRRFQNDGFASLSSLYFQSNRSDEPQEEIPFVLPELELRERFDAPYIGGDLFANGGILGLTREDGRDVMRFSGGVDWERSFTTDVGFGMRGFAEGRADYYVENDDPVTDDAGEGRLLGLAGVEIGYPLVRHGERNTQIFQPIAQFILSNEGGNPDSIVNEDSQEVSFDHTNLFTTSRATGQDLWEEGTRLNVGWRYELLSDGGLDLSATGGRVLRFEEANEFSVGSGLDGTNSDYVAAWSVGYDDAIRLTNRFRLSDDFQFARNELRAELEYGRWNADASYVFFEGDAETESIEDREELRFEGDVDVTPSWNLSGNMRYDVERDNFLRLGSGVRYRNDCVEVDFNIGKRFTATTGAPAATTFSFEVKLLSVALSNEDRAARRSCG